MGASAGKCSARGLLAALAIGVAVAAIAAGVSAQGDRNPDLVPLLNLEQWGVPTSRPTHDPNNRNFVYLRFQRGIMHHDASNAATQGLLLADYLKSIITGVNLPTDLDQQASGSQFYHQYNPSRPSWVDRPDQMPATDLTFAFERQ